MTTITASDVTPDQLVTLNTAKDSLPDGALKQSLESISANIERGENVLVEAADATVTPSEASRLLGLSRTHLYKVLDSGALPFHTVGVRDRRILARDLFAYRDRLHAAQRHTATVFAGGTNDDDAALDEMS